MTTETETEKARAFLWELQAQAAEATGMRDVAQATDWQERMVEIGRRMPEVSEEQLRQAVESGMSPLEHWPPRGPDEPLWGYRLIHSLADRLETAFTGSFTRPVLGMLITGEINAVTLLAPDSQTHIVAFESELFMFANLFGKAVALAMPHEFREDGSIAFSPGIDDVRRHVRDSPEAARRFRDVVLAYVLRGRPSGASPYVPTQAVRVMGSILLDGMELFVLGHEYGHVMAGHLADRKTSRRMLGTGDVDVTEVAWEWEQEAVADIIGWKLCVGAMGAKFGLELAHAGVELFFSACEVLDRAVSLLLTGEYAPDPGSSTHPPIDVRRGVVREQVRAELGENAASLLDMGTMIQEIVDVLWEETAPVILDLHRQGAAPDARWTANL
ncbi:hypothetical protein ACFQ9H_00420 [Streptomyces sp. NPDC056517]|uniref:hypothetical protein n=1 Tax=Streptomyces sp. NPDC056517 TaxID=3345848 RepID=UPI0036A218DB